jgi:hypothetical protein
LQPNGIKTLPGTTLLSHQGSGKEYISSWRVRNRGNRSEVELGSPPPISSSLTHEGSVKEQTLIERYASSAIKEAERNTTLLGG